MLTIECIPKTNCKGCFLIIIDGEHWREIHASIFGRKPLLPHGDTLDEFEREFEQAEYKKAMQYALKKLSMRGLLSSQLQDVLIEKCVSEKTCTRIINECQRLGYLNDQAWVDSYIRGCLRRKLGPQAIAMKLRAKGVPSDVIKKAISSFSDEDSERSSIQHLLQTRLQKYDLNIFIARKKAISFLLRRGFSLETIEKCL